MAAEDFEAWGRPELEICQFVRHGLLDSIEDPDLVNPHVRDAHGDGPHARNDGQEGAGADGESDMGTGMVGVADGDDYIVIEDGAQETETNYYMEEGEEQDLSIGGGQDPMSEGGGWQVIPGQN